MAVRSGAVRVATREELARRGRLTVSAGRRRVVVFLEGGELFALDNRCPHMGFPLDRGTLEGGILTCHWHEARFDARTGCSFDVWADDAPGFDVWIEGDAVWVAGEPRTPPDSAYHLRRLRRALEQDVPLVQARSALALLERGAGARELLIEALEFATRRLDRYGQGLTRVTCVANLDRWLSPRTRYLAWNFALRQLARDAAQAVPLREYQALGDVARELAQLRPWLVQWVRTRHRDGALRTLRTGVERLERAELAELVFEAAAERVYADGGHLLDACNKTFELCEHTGFARAPELFALLGPELVSVRGGEEQTHWHHPVELIEPLRALERRLPRLLERGAAREAEGDGDAPAHACAERVELWLGDDPLAILAGLERTLEQGVRPELLAREIAYAAGLRLARFATTNEVGDWFNPQHTFIFASAVHQAVRRRPTAPVVRALLQGAIAVYHDRFLNVPPARLASEAELAALPEKGDAILARLLETLDRRAEVETAARLVSRYFRIGLPRGPLIDALALATVREDLDFHPLQLLDAGVRQLEAWQGSPEAEHLLVGVVRNLAAHCPTPRAGQQTAEIALRLHRGDNLFDER